MKKTLIIGPSWVGDMMMSQSLYKTLKKLYPEKKIDVLAPRWCNALLDKMPEINKKIDMPITHGEFKLKKRYQIGKELRNIYDEVYVLPNSFKSALIPFFAKIPKRIGWKGEMRYGLLNDIRTLDKTKYPLMVERYIALAYPEHTDLSEKIIFPELHIQENESLDKFNLKKDTKVLGLCPGAKFGKSKMWPEKYFAETAKTKLKHGWQVWIFGSADENEMINRICQMAPGCVNLAGKTTLSEAIEILNETDIVISNDSGLMHIATALKKPMIAIYGSTTPSFTPPLHHNPKLVKILKHKIHCSPCFKRTCKYDTYECLEKITPNLVLNNIDLLENESINSKIIIYG